MKKLALFIMLMIPVFCWSQSTDRYATNETIVSNWDRLNIDFEVKNISHPDQDVIATINLSQYDTMRQENHDVEVHDSNSGYTLILYSNTKVFHKKKHRDEHPGHTSPNHQH